VDNETGILTLHATEPSLAALVDDSDAKVRIAQNEDGEPLMTRALILAATALALSAGAASAQAVYVTPGYGYVAPAYVTPAPAYVAPAPTYVAPPVVSHYYAAPSAVVVSRPVYDYAPGYAGVIAGPGW
jgi:hypothetical protein